MAAHPSLLEHVEKANRWLADAGESELSFIQTGDCLQLCAPYSVGYTKTLPVPWFIEVDQFPGVLEPGFLACTVHIHDERRAFGINTGLEKAIEVLLVERYRERLHTNLENAVLDRVAHDELGGMKDGELS